MTTGVKKRVPGQYAYNIIIHTISHFSACLRVFDFSLHI